jgi:hypothetical protein
LILNTPRASQLGTGIDGATFQESDAILVVPNLLLTTVEVPYGTRVLTSSVDPARTSFITELQNTRVNQVTAFERICTFGKGLWDVQVGLCWKFDYNSISLGAAFGLYWGNTVFSVRIQGCQPSVGTFVFTLNRRILVPDDSYFLQNFYGTTGVAENAVILVGVTASKLV